MACGAMTASPLRRTSPLGALVLCPSPQAAHTVVNGRSIVRDGRLVAVELGPLLERHNQLAMDLMM